MTDFNPLAGSILGSTQAQHQVEIEKQRQVRRAQALRRDIAARDDEMEHQVESSEELPPVGDKPEERHQGGQQSPGKGDANEDESPHIDLKA